MHARRAAWDALQAEYRGIRDCVMSIMRRPRRLKGDRRMGMTLVRARLANMADRERWRDVAIASVVRLAQDVLPALRT